MFKQQRFILRVLLCAVGLTSIFGLDKAWAMSWLGGEKIDAPLVKVSFCSGGDMLGSSHGLFVTAVDKEYALLKEGEPIKLLNDSIGQGERYIHPKYSEEFYIKLAKRLEAGNYTLNIDGYTTNFSIK
ncbi:MAG: hypothetical protein SOV56_02190 [Phascolarctobacterium sp.]|nr:hypothetical protein [Phascolarctobacterium sp.]